MEPPHLGLGCNVQNKDCIFPEYSLTVCGYNISMRDFPGGSVAKTALPMQWAHIQSLVSALDPTLHN